MANIELHPFSQNDFKELISWVRSPEELFIWSATTFTFPLDEKQLERHFQEAQTSKLRLMYTAVDRESKEHIGHIELTRIDRENKKVSIAYVLVDPAKRGRGYGDALMQSILNECFDHMKMLKVDLFVFEFNPVAIHCYQKTGFEMEEVIGDRIKLKDNFVTLYLMGLSYEKWKAFKSQGDHNKPG
jgi:RimJ/RimL family protein N-acetyltransferase